MSKDPTGRDEGGLLSEMNLSCQWAIVWARVAGPSQLQKFDDDIANPIYGERKEASMENAGSLF